MKLIIGLIVLGFFWWSWKKKGAVGLVAAIIVFFVIDETWKGLRGKGALSSREAVAERGLRFCLKEALHPITRV